VMGGKKEIYRDVRFFHGAIQLTQRKTQYDSRELTLTGHQ